MSEITLIGIDLARHFFRINGACTNAQLEAQKEYEVFHVAANGAERLSHRRQENTKADSLLKQGAARCAVPGASPLFGTELLLYVCSRKKEPPEGRLGRHEGRT